MFFIKLDSFLDGDCIRCLSWKYRYFFISSIFIRFFLFSEYSEQGVPAVFVYVMYFIHALPFTNSAINWILYGEI